MSQDRACAVAVRLLDLGYFRIGNDVYGEENGSCGLNTLRREHVRKQGSTMVFCFVGKSGIEHRITIDDPATVEAYANPKRGWERLYVQTVQQANTGADLDFLVGASGDQVTRESH